jgi:hypothetical protein
MSQKVVACTLNSLLGNGWGFKKKLIKVYFCFLNRNKKIK